MTRADPTLLLQAELVLTAFARSQLKAWFARYAKRLKKSQRLIVKRTARELEVSIDEELDEPDSDTQGYMYWSRPMVLYVAKQPSMAFPELVVHELTHFVAMLRWRYGGHGRHFTMTENQIKKEGMA